MVRLNHQIFEVTLKTGRAIYVYGGNLKSALRNFNIKMSDVLWYKTAETMEESNKIRLKIRVLEKGKHIVNFLRFIFRKPVFIDIDSSMSEYWDAFYNNDERGMRRALMHDAKNCPHLNPDCLYKVYCPDCNFFNKGEN